MKHVASLYLTAVHVLAVVGGMSVIFPHPTLATWQMAMICGAIARFWDVAAKRVHR